MMSLAEPMQQQLSFAIMHYPYSGQVSWLDLLRPVLRTYQDSIALTGFGTKL